MLEIYGKPTPINVRNVLWLCDELALDDTLHAYDRTRFATIWLHAANATSWTDSFAVLRWATLAHCVESREVRMSSWLRRKSIDQVTVHEAGRQLVRSLSWPHLIALGIGAIVGTGIYTLIGVGADKAGPAVLLSFVAAGIVCACAALAYAEMATMMPAAGSAYTYSYTALGESIAWVVGWSLVLEYSLVVSTVAVGWSGYFVGFLQWLGASLPHELIAGPHAGGIANLPAVVITFLVAGMLMAGTRESATLNAVLVVLKIIALGVFVAIALPTFKKRQPAAVHAVWHLQGHGSRWRGARGDGGGGDHLLRVLWLRCDFHRGRRNQEPRARSVDRHRRLDDRLHADLCAGGTGRGGCDALHRVWQESRTVGADPARTRPRQGGPGDRCRGDHCVADGAAGVFLYGQSRIFFVMSRDGLLPRGLSKVNARTGTPVAITLLTAVLVAALAGVARLDEIAALANAGTLAAFTAVAACLLVLRVREPGRARAFRTPLAWVVGPVAILGCLYLFWSLPSNTQGWFLLWNALGVVVYLAYGRRNSRLNSAG